MGIWSRPPKFCGTPKDHGGRLQKVSLATWKLICVRSASFELLRNLLHGCLLKMKAFGLETPYEKLNWQPTIRDSAAWVNCNGRSDGSWIGPFFTDGRFVAFIPKPSLRQPSVFGCL